MRTLPGGLKPRVGKRGLAGKTRTIDEKSVLVPPLIRRQFCFSRN